MQNLIQKSLLYTLLLVFTISCENEVDVSADWEEIAVVYGALNPTDDTNYLRINRAFLDENESALRYIDNPDSLYFESLEVYLDEFRNNSYTKTISASLVNGEDFGLSKDSGFFYSESNPLYQITDKIQASTFINDYTYSLTVRNPLTGYTCSGLTLSNGKPEVTNPVSENSPRTVFPRATDDHNIYVSFKEGKHVRAYTIEMIIRVEEFKTSDPSSSTVIPIKWNLVNGGRTRRLSGFEEAIYLVPSSSFFATISSALTADTSLSRRLVDYDINFYGISEDFSTYLSVTSPSIGIIQKKPEFTNLTNGLGIFTSRHITRFDNQKFDAQTTVEMQLSEFTDYLNFVN